MTANAPTDHPVHELIARRHSPRTFGTDLIGDRELLSILEAGRWAASSFNEQPWSFIVSRCDQTEPWHRLLDCLMPRNREWAQHASVLMLAIAHPQFVRNGRSNAHAGYDTGQAVAQMVLEATSRGIVAHQMAGFDADKARAAFAIPDDHVPLTAIAMAHAATPPTEVGTRSRKPLSDFVFGDRFGAAASMLD